jgi:hypothetical protein
VNPSILVSAESLDPVLVDISLTFGRLQSPWSLGVQMGKSIIPTMY